MVRHVILYSGSAGLLKLAGFVLVVWLAKRLTVAEYATWGLLYSLQVGVALLGAVGIIESVIALLKLCPAERDRNRLFAAANGVFTFNIMLAAVLSSFLYLAVAERTAASAYTYSWVLASGGLLAASALQAQFVRLEEKHAASLYFSFVAPMAGMLGSLIAVMVEMSARSFYLGSALGLGLALACGKIAGIGSFAFTRSVADWKPILVRVGPFAAVGLLGWLSGYGNNYVTELWFDAAEVAKFTLAFMLVGILQLVASAMNQVWSPRFYRLMQEQPAEEVELRNRRFFQWQAVALGGTGALLIFIFPIAARLAGGNLAVYQSMRLELYLLVVAYIAIVPFWHCQNYLLVHDNGPAMMKIHVISSLIGITVLAGLLVILGPLGVYVGFLVQMVLRSAAAVFVSRKKWRISIGWEGVGAGIGIAFGGFLLG